MTTTTLQRNDGTMFLGLTTIEPEQTLPMATEVQALIALEEIDRILQERMGMRKGNGDVGLRMSAPATSDELCGEYRRIRKRLDVALTLIERIPVYGRKTASAIRFLMQMADNSCGLPDEGQGQNR